MIVSFSVSNFRSFSSEETLSLVASNRVADRHEDHAIPIPDSKEKVLRTAVLYGANGAGKSNVLAALRFLESTALESRPRKKGTGRDAFRFGDFASSASSFDLQFVAANKLFRFGLKLDDERILEEWLYQVTGNKQRTIYQRVTGADGAVVIDAGGLKTAGPKIQALATVGGPQNQSFLATVNATLEREDFGEDLDQVSSWFKTDLSLVSPRAYYPRLGHYLDRDADFQTFAGSFLKASSTGIERLEVARKELTRDELSGLLPASLFSKLLKDLETEKAGILSLGDGKELIIERKGEEHFYEISIQAAHEHGAVVKLDLKDESDGTRRLLHLLPALYHLQTGGAVYFIDEIDRSLHPILVKEFLQFFLKSCNGRYRQLIVTTHESNLLDLDLLRRDEIWFVEKDESGSSRLYSLLDFKVRNDLEIRKHYLQGRFGAVPFLGNLDQLTGQLERVP